MHTKLAILCLCLCLLPALAAQDQPVKQLLKIGTMRGASFSLMVKDVGSGEALYEYDADRELTPASVLKLVTSAAALELLGEDYRYETALEYDGKIVNGTLEGNLYIRGSGDPTLGSSHFAENRSGYTPDRNTFMPQWIQAVAKAGIRRIAGAVIADESIFDTEGISMKWVHEDMGSYYGAGSYGISVFDNLYRLYLNTGVAGSTPEIVETAPAMPAIHFHNYLKAASVKTDSCYIVGAPFANDRYLYGVIPAGKERFPIRGDIPDPALFLAQYTSDCLRKEGIDVEGTPTCYRILSAGNNWPTGERKALLTTCSPTLREIVRIVNERSHNLFADALLKTLGLQYKGKPGEVISSMGKGVEVVKAYWRERGLDVSSLRMYDGSGLAAADKVTASFVCRLLCYMMGSQARQPDAFLASLPKAGLEGSAANFLKGSPLQGKALLKSGGMSGVRSFAGYVTKDGRQYAVAVFVNNYSGESRLMLRNLEKLFVSLF
ncbi:MAG: D-alanyl-D-alanine carboxypeptidase/D-alanyl-D-alanine-endopeptidase [Tannerellaceae bacterium]|jgi:D-alanyl-D-alanine carboxypeptidase/D-alanyl-D-alanine-endopeptidase (penicillin-binding protein 4)|nr:D-alanyl-D-alanine carboxypeptidase/D-alanyl-D-alanine-endopeptidase [Tannerellaceae bacterium]